MPARKKKTNGAPRDANGRYLPRSQWSKADIKRFEHMKRNGELKTGPRKNRVEENSLEENSLEENPMVIRRSKSGKEHLDYLEPRDQRGKFVDRSRWSKKERALHEQMRQQGFFARRSLSRKRRIAKRYEKGETSLALSPSPGMKNIERMLQRLEQRMYESDMKDRIQSVLDAIERKDRYYPPANRHGGGEASCVNDGRCNGNRGIIPGANSPRIGAKSGEVPVTFKSSGGTIIEMGSDANICDDPEMDYISGCLGIEPIKKRQEAIIDRIEEFYKQFPTFKDLTQKAGVKKNPGGKYSIVTDTINFAKYHPLLAVAGAGAILFIAYSLYRAFTAFMASRGISLGSGGGVSISRGVMTFGREAPYTITQDDMVWLARGAYSEVNPSSSGWDDAEKQRGAAAVMYAMANHLMTVGQKRQTFQTLGNLIKNYCQPLSPRWASAGAAGCQGSPGNCTTERLAHRAAMRTKQWGTFPAQLERMVQDFSAGTLANPIGRRTGWVAQYSATSHHMSQSPQVVARNLFIIDTNAREATA